MLILPRHWGFADANIVKGRIPIVTVIHCFELRVMAVRCISSIARLRKYMKFQ